MGTILFTVFALAASLGPRDEDEHHPYKFIELRENHGTTFRHALGMTYLSAKRMYK